MKILYNHPEGPKEVIVQEIKFHTDDASNKPILIGTIQEDAIYSNCILYLEDVIHIQDNKISF